MTTLGLWYFIKMGKFGDKGQGADGVLISPEGVQWQAVTGPKGKGEIPDGIWRIGGIRTTGLGYHFRDGAGNYWICGIYNEAIRITRGRWNFAIHPDGSTPRGGIWQGPDGTHGCIGLTEYDTRGVKRALSRSRGSVLIIKHKGVSDDALHRMAAYG